MRTCPTVYVLCFCLAHAAAHAETLQRIGHAYDKRTGKLVFVEHHEELFDEGRLQRCTVTYRDGDGVVFARKALDFSHAPLRPDFRFEDRRTGYVEGVKTNAETRVLELRRGHAREWTRIELDTPADAIFDAGFERFIERHWDRLLAGEQYKRDFLLPGRKGFVKFRISEHEQPDPARVAIELKLSVFLIGLFIDPIYLTYDRETRTLLEYSGISNVRDLSTKNMKVRIEFARTADTAS